MYEIFIKNYTIFYFFAGLSLLNAKKQTLFIHQKPASME